MLHKSFPAEFKIDEAKGVFTGYASIFGFKDSYGDIVEPGAFAKSIAERGDRVKVLWQHDMYSPIGKPIKMIEDSRGLLTESRIAKTSLGKDALILMQEGIITELSIGYDSIKESFDNSSNTRHLLELRLWEYSPVTWAANEMAVVTGVKNAGDLEALLLKIAQIKDLGLKAGRVLSAQNMSRLEEAIKTLQDIYASAQSEPDKSTQTDSKAAGEPGDHSAAGLLEFVKQVDSYVGGQKLLDDLRAFGEELRRN